MYKLPEIPNCPICGKQLQMEYSPPGTRAFSHKVEDKYSECPFGFQHWQESQIDAIINLTRAQQRSHLTAFGVPALALIVGVALGYIIALLQFGGG